MGDNRRAILALDLASATGWAIAAPGSRDGALKVRWGTWDLPKTDHPGERYQRLHIFLDMAQNRLGPFQVLVAERPGYTRSLAAAKVQNGLWATSAGWAYCEGVDFIETSPDEWKKWFVGHGRRGGKNATIQAVRKAGFSVANDNEADAMAILIHTCYCYGSDIRGKVGL